MTGFNLIVTLGLACLFWASAGAAYNLMILRRHMGEEARLLHRVDIFLNQGGTLTDAALKALRGQEEPPLMGTLWARLVQGVSLSSGLLDRVEEETIAPGVHRALNISQIAPACGLLGTTAGIAVGLMAAKESAAAAADGLIRVLPAALLSTFFALAFAIALRIIVSGVVAQWARLRRQTMALCDTPQRGWVSEPPLMDSEIYDVAAQ